VADKVQVEVQQTTKTVTVVSSKWVFTEEIKTVQPATPAQGVSQ
jgi:hypothetical protein